ncbi:MAG: NhaP-type Na+/H+ or K+/H+ antiporter [Planctomycetota bacterium]|jgi:NhaP-type Na+/H+ or K+/H+ antiporter
MDPLYLIAGLVAVGVLAQLIASRVRLPALVVLLTFGIIAGPVTGWVDPDLSFGELLKPVVSLAVALILFEGGLSLRFAEVRKLGAPLIALVLGGLVIAFTTTTLLARYLADFSWATSAVFGAILVVTGPTVVKPMLRQARIKRRPALLLKWESIVNDPFGALLAVIILHVATAGAGELGHSALLICASAIIGLVSGLLLGAALKRGLFPEHLKTPAIVGGALAVFAGCEALYHEAGLLAVTITGVVLANTRSSSIEEVRRFKEEVATILVAVLFLVLAARMRFSDLEGLTLGAVLLIPAILFVVRPLVSGLSLAGSGLPWQEKFLIGWIAPRGIVAVAMAGTLAPRLDEAGFADAHMLVPVIFGVVIATVLLHGMTIGPIARALGLSGRGGGGLLIIGASNWAIELALLLKGEGVDVVVCDSNYRNTSQARMRGIETVHGDVLSEKVQDELPLERLSWVLAGTGDGHFNSLACLALVKLMGRENVLQLRSGVKEEEDDSHLNGRMPWEERVSFGALTSRHWSGGTFRCTQLDKDNYDWEEFLHNEEHSLPLFAITSKGIEPIEARKARPDDDRIVYMTSK